MTSVLAFEDVKADLRKRLGRQWPAGTRLPPIKQLAADLNTGHRRMLRAVQELAAEGLLTSTQRRGTIVSEDLNRSTPAAPSLAGTVIQVLADFGSSDPFIVEMYKGFEEVLAPQGVVLRHADPRGSEVSNDEWLRQFDRRVVQDPEIDAVCLVNPPGHMDIACDPHQVLIALSSASHFTVAMPDRYDIVTVDQEQGGYLAGLRLAEIGCQGVCFVGRIRNTLRDVTSAMRLEGLERGLGYPLPADHVIDAQSYSPDDGATAVPVFLSLRPRPQGVFAATDELAVGFIAGALSHGLRPGRDYQIIGFDRQLIGQTLAAGPLSTIQVPSRLIGLTGARILQERLASPTAPPRRIGIGCTLFQGATARQTHPPGSL